MKNGVEAAATEIGRHWSTVPQVALVLGTGLGHFADQVSVEAAIAYEQIPGFTRTTALAHRGQLVCGSLLDVPLFLFDGRCHLYEGYSFAEVTFPIHVAQACGAAILIVTNASGGVNYHYAPGDIMIIDDHLDLLCGSGRRETAGRASLRPPRLSVTPYDPELIELASQFAAEHRILVHRGVYAAVTGPNYETRAEYAFLRQIGADVVGMSTVPEVQVASQLGMRVLGLSVVTNVAHLQHPTAIDAWHVVSAAEEAEPQLRLIIDDVVRSLSV